MPDQPWLYFISLERDFVQTLNYVQLDRANFATYSNEYAKLLLLIGSEVDVVAKMVCRDVDPSSNAKNIVDYQFELCRIFPGIHSVEINIGLYGIKISPWLSWESTDAASPPWWKSYNSVKHGRDADFPQANLENVLTALCALLILNLYRLRRTDWIEPIPTLLDDGFPVSLHRRGTRQLPGV